MAVSLEGGKKGGILIQLECLEMDQLQGMAGSRNSNDTMRMLFLSQTKSLLIRGKTAVGSPRLISYLFSNVKRKKWSSLKALKNSDRGSLGHVSG